MEGTSVTVAQGAGRSYGSLAKSDAPRWCSVVPRSTRYPNSYTSLRVALVLRCPRPRLLLSQYLLVSALTLSFPLRSSLYFSLYVTYKGFHDDLAALSAMVSARLAPPFLVMNAHGRRLAYR